MGAEIHVGDIGTIIRGTAKDGSAIVDVSTATTKDFIFRKPDGTVITRSTVFTTDGTNGQIEYVTVSGDLDRAGTWSVQLHIILPTGEWKSDIFKFDVYANLG